MTVSVDLASNTAVERTAGSPSLASAAHCRAFAAQGKDLACPGPAEVSIARAANGRSDRLMDRRAFISTGALGLLAVPRRMKICFVLV